MSPRGPGGPLRVVEELAPRAAYRKDMSADDRTESIGERIRRLRLEQGMSQRSLSCPGVSAGYISRIEAGDRHPSVRALRLMAGRLGVSAEYLETGDNAVGPDRRFLELADARLELRFADNPEVAGQKFQALLEEATAAGDHAVATRAQAGLGVTAAQQGEHADAIPLLEPVVTQRGVRPAVDPDVFAALAQSYVATGSLDRALALLESALEELRATKADNSSAYLSLATYLSYARADAGDIAGARAALDDALTHADTFADPENRIRLYWSQARLAAGIGEHATARTYIGRAIALLEDAEDAVRVARAQLIYAESLLEDAQVDDAARRLEAAQPLLAGRGRPRDLATLALLSSQVALARGDFETAAQLARDAVGHAESDHPEYAGRAETALGEALYRAGDADGALAAFERADALLADGEPRFAQALFRGWSDVLESEGRLPDALRILRRAAELARRAPGSRQAPAAPAEQAADAS